MRILICEDEIPLSRALIKIFEKNNYSADAVMNGKDAVDYIMGGDYDAVVLDVMMPEYDGFSVLGKVRGAGCSVPILMLTAKSEVDDRVRGLDSGADDYLTKPFDTKELLARIRCITRTKDGLDSKVHFSNLTLDRATYELSSPTGSFRLANKEYQLAELFMQNPHITLSTVRIMEKIWGYDSESEINVVWVYISCLRKKFNALGAECRIKAFRNAGYSLEEE